MGLLDRVRQHREAHPVKPKPGRLIPTKRVLRSCENPRSEGEALVKEWALKNLYYDPQSCEYVGTCREDWQHVQYLRQTLWASYEAFCAERQAVPCSIKSFIRRLLNVTESLGWPPVYRDRAYGTRRMIVRGVRLRSETTRWTGEDGTRNRNKRKTVLSTTESQVG
jgi:hypothetical protein